MNNGKNRWLRPNLSAQGISAQVEIALVETEWLCCGNLGETVRKKLILYFLAAK